MHHPWLALLFYSACFVVAALAGVFVLGPAVRRVSAGRLRGMVALWLALTALLTAAQYYGDRYLSDGRPPTLMSQAVMPCFFVTMYTAALARRSRSRGKGAA